MCQLNLGISLHSVAYMFDQQLVMSDQILLHVIWHLSGHQQGVIITCISGI